MTTETTNIDVNTGCDDREGRLVMIDGQLAAVIVKLSDEMHGDDCGRWNVEAVFHRCEHPSKTFATVAEATAWIEARIARSG